MRVSLTCPQPTLSLPKDLVPASSCELPANALLLPDMLQGGKYNQLHSLGPKGVLRAAESF